VIKSLANARIWRNGCQRYCQEMPTFAETGLAETGYSRRDADRSDPKVHECGPVNRHRWRDRFERDTRKGLTSAETTLAKTCNGRRNVNCGEQVTANRPRSIAPHFLNRENKTGCTDLTSCQRHRHLHGACSYNVRVGVSIEQSIE
jgi:hypothetical protein